MLYRILTENKNRKQLINEVGKKFDGFTVIKGQGYWKGQVERSLIIEIVTNDEYEIKELCNKIKVINEQECVLLESFNISTEFI